MKKVMVVFGTRPEAIKMCPLVKELKAHSEEFKTVVCVTGQHKQMLKSVLDVFEIQPQYDLKIMQPGQSLTDVTVNVLRKFQPVLEEEMPDIVLVHGDTSTAFAAGLSSFYHKIPVGHVEAGLRTYDLDSPFPEEFNRQAIGTFAKIHFAPTDKARENLLREGKRAEDIVVTGNTAIDAMRTTVTRDYKSPLLNWVGDNSRLLLLTAHRRENLGQPMRQMFQAIYRVLEECPDTKIVYPVHLNPYVQKVAKEVFGDHPRVQLVEPMDVVSFHNLMAHSFVILTDSGGIQEEAPSLGKPVLVMRDTTERPEGIEAGTLKLVGTSEDAIYTALKTLLTDVAAYQTMSHAENPYGDGYACQKITKELTRRI